MLRGQREFQIHSRTHMLLHGMDELSQVKDTASWHQLAFGGIVFWALIHDRKSTLALDAKPLFFGPIRPFVHSGIYRAGENDGSEKTVRKGPANMLAKRFQWEDNYVALMFFRPFRHLNPRAITFLWQR
jgi:hypothetical protein